MNKKLLVAVSICILVNGCASTSDPKTGVDSSDTEQEPVDKTETTRTVEPEQARVITTASYEATAAPVNKKDIPASREAVLDLMSQSKQAIDIHAYDDAESILNRALRIEPGNAWLWYNMAVISFYQADYHQAIQQALKSNNLERQSRSLRNNNYRIIEQSYIKLGEPAKAQHIRKKIVN